MAMFTKKPKDAEAPTLTSQHVEHQLRKYEADVASHHASALALRAQIADLERQQGSVEAAAVLSGDDPDVALAALEAQVDGLKAELAQRETAGRRAAVVRDELAGRHHAARKQEAEDEREQLAAEYGRLTKQAEGLLRQAAALLDRRNQVDAREDELRRSALLQSAGGGPAPTRIDARWLPDLSSLGEQLEDANRRRLS